MFLSKVLLLLRHREVKTLVWDHTVSQQQEWDWDLAICTRAHSSLETSLDTQDNDEEQLPLPWLYLTQKRMAKACFLSSQEWSLKLTLSGHSLDSWRLHYGCLSCLLPSTPSSLGWTWWGGHSLENFGVIFFSKWIWNREPACQNVTITRKGFKISLTYSMFLRPLN